MPELPKWSPVEHRDIWGEYDDWHAGIQAQNDAMRARWSEQQQTRGETQTYRDIDWSSLFRRLGL